MSANYYLSGLHRDLLNRVSVIVNVDQFSDGILPIP